MVMDHFARSSPFEDVQSEETHLRFSKVCYKMVKVWNQKYYYLDSSLQLELNLHSARRALLQLIEDFGHEDCWRCTSLKCLCDFSRQRDQLSDSGKDSKDSEDQPPPPPPARDLPRPEFESSSEEELELINVEAWVRASTPDPNKTWSPGSKRWPLEPHDFSWPPTPKSVWNDYKIKINKPEINMGTVSQADNVEEFFRSFSLNVCTGPALAQNRLLMQQLRKIANKSSEYSYF